MPAPRPSSDYRRIASKGYGLIILTFGVFGGWAALASIDSAVIAQGVWFARAVGPQVRLYHAVVYTAKPRPEVADQFFSGLARQ